MKPLLIWLIASLNALAMAAGFSREFSPAPDAHYVLYPFAKKSAEEKAVEMLAWAEELSGEDLVSVMAQLFRVPNLPTKAWLEFELIAVSREDVPWPDGEKATILGDEFASDQCMRAFFGGGLLQAGVTNLDLDQLHLSKESCRKYLKKIITETLASLEKTPPTPVPLQTKPKAGVR